MFEFDGILLKPSLLQPCFHVAGMCSGRFRGGRLVDAGGVAALTNYYYY